ncbi:MAG: hypothetical protein ABJB01_07165 [Rudaea sp.]
MPCSVAIEDRPHFLFVTITGDNTPDTLRTYTTEIPQACIKYQKLRVLVVVQLTGPELSMLDVYQGVATGSDNVVGLGMRVAYVDEDPSHGTDSMMLAENVARSRGVAVRTFRHAGQAEQWLVSDDPF